MTIIATTTLAKTPLTDWHAANGGRLVDFAGWEMPVQYGSITDEHVATRTAVGLFDVSHMGRLTVAGPQATEFLESLLTRSVENLKPSRIRYSLVCNESGGTLDDILVGCVSKNEAGSKQAGSKYDLVVNASNREKLVDWFTKHTDGFDVALTDNTVSTAMIAVQGPEALSLLKNLSDADLSALKYYQACEAKVGDAHCVASRTGYTGEDGVELICSAEEATPLWEKLIAAGAKACGLAARDTLRLEAGMPLYGHEMTEEINPAQVGLGFAINTKERSFVGSEAIVKAASDESLPVRVGLEVEGRRPPREGYPVVSNFQLSGDQPASEQSVEDQPVGWVSSGAPSPTLGKMIAMAFVPKSLSQEGTDLGVNVRGKVIPAKVVPLPFYKRS